MRLRSVPPGLSLVCMTEDTSGIDIRRDDGKALIGVLAVLEGLIRAGRIGPSEVTSLRRRLARDGVIEVDDRVTDGGTDDVATGLGDLNVRLRRALGEVW
ncbi:hypothetical protein [Herbiconiux sp.]|uniref:hypothetical protein n=1 Tax=Herbiconiux sp. TaxID=1871186 RepID=UPI0025C1C744|nr:hypothetical protein [Herbiconiux sp.]